MIIGVLSDTHDRLPAIAQALAVFQARGVQTVVHAGDLVAPFAANRLLDWPGPLYVIYGNNDGERKGLRGVLPMIQDGPLSFIADGKHLLVHHFIDWCGEAEVAKADVIITGHTHEVCNEPRDGKLFLNPGECGGWISGRCTVAVLDTDTLAAEIIEIKA